MKEASASMGIPKYSNLNKNSRLDACHSAQNGSHVLQDTATMK